MLRGVLPGVETPGYFHIVPLGHKGVSPEYFIEA
jgi:hypothetical protein